MSEEWVDECKNILKTKYEHDKKINFKWLLITIVILVFSTIMWIVYAVKGNDTTNWIMFSACSLVCVLHRVYIDFEYKRQLSNIIKKL